MFGEIGGSDPTHSPGGENVANLRLILSAMSEEPNKQIDQLLRDYSQERKKGADLEMPHLTRKILHDEVRKTWRNPAQEQKSWWNWMRSFWPKIAFASGLCGILVIAIISLRERPRPPVQSQPISDSFRTEQFSGATDATSESKAEAEASVETLAAAALDTKRGAKSDSAAPVRPRLETLAGGDASTLADNERTIELKKQLPAIVAERSLALDHGPSSPKLSTSEPAARASEVKDKRPSSNLTQTKIPPTPSASPSSQTTSEKLARATGLTNLGGAMRLRFTDLTERSTASRRDNRSGVLTSFQMEQNGNELRFYEGDGSVYSGQMTPATERDRYELGLSLTGSAGGRNVSQAMGDLTQKTAVYLFRAHGTNRTLGKNVMLEGRYLERTNEIRSAESTFSFATGATEKTGLEKKNASSSRRAIIGRATVGSTNQIPVSAVSIDP